jgi:hypothetical protein
MWWQTAAARVRDVGLMDGLYNDPKWNHEINQVYTDARKQALKFFFE